MREIVAGGQARYASLTPEDRSVFKDSIRPHAEKAREARRVLGRFDSLDQDYKAADELLKDTEDSSMRDYLSQCKSEIAEERAKLGGNVYRDIAREDQRKAINEVIIETNQLRSRLQAGITVSTPLALSLDLQPQVPLPPSRKRREPHAPPLLHHGFGILPSQRRTDVPDDIKLSLSRGIIQEHQGDVVVRDVSLAVAHLLPSNLISRDMNKRPSDFRRSVAVAEGILTTADLILAYERRELLMPHPENYAMPNADQEKYIEAAVRFILINHLYDELANPNRDEDKYRLTIQRNISGAINRVATLIGGRGYERVAQAIESLPDVEAALLRSRLSISEDIKLGFPRSDLAHEKRFGEMCAWAIFGNHNRGKNNSANREAAVNLILEKLGERVDVGDIQIEEIFEYFESLEYGEILIRQVYEAANDENRDLLLDMLTESGYFLEVRRSLRRDTESLGYAYSLEDLSDIDD